MEKLKLKDQNLSHGICKKEEGISELGKFQSCLSYERFILRPLFKKKESEVGHFPSA
jgi:hypothetical protein